MLGDRGRGAGLHVGRRAELERDLLVADIAGQPAEHGLAVVAAADVVGDPHAVPDPVRAAELDRRPDRVRPGGLAGVDGVDGVLLPEVAEGGQEPLRREADLGPGDVEAGHALVAVGHGQFGDRRGRFQMPHRGDQLPDHDRLATTGTCRHALGQTVAHRLDGVGQAEAAGQVLLGSPARLGVHDAVSGQVLDELPGDSAKVGRGLHDRDRVGEGLQEQLQGSGAGCLDEPAAQCLGIVGGKRVADLVGQLQYGGRPQRTVEMIMERHLGEGAQGREVDGHDRSLSSRRWSGPNACGSTAVIGRMPSGVSSSSSGPPCSQSSCRQRPQGIRASPALSTQANATSRPPPVATK